MCQPARTAHDSYSDIAGQLPRDLTYRQIHHWITQYPNTFTVGCARARGRRHFAAGDVEALTVMARLVDAGLTVAAAAEFASRRTRTGPLSPYVTIQVRHNPATSDPDAPPDTTTR